MNAEKCKELRISFNVNPVQMNPIVVNGENREVVESIKLLKLTINRKLTWNDHIDDVVRKINKRLCFLSQLKRAKIKSKELALFYTLCIRSVADYAIPAFYYSLLQYQKNDLIRLEIRAIAIIIPNVEYRDALKLLNIKPMKSHRKIYVIICFDLLCSTQIIRFFIYYVKDIIRATLSEKKTILIFLILKLIGLKTHLFLPCAISLISHVEYASCKF